MSEIIALYKNVFFFTRRPRRVRVSRGPNWITFEIIDIELLFSVAWDNFAAAVQIFLMLNVNKKNN